MTAITITDLQPAHSTDQVIRILGTWAHFQMLKQGFERSPGAKLAFYQGVIEILMPGRAHELFAELIGHLLMIFFTTKGIFFIPTGSMDQQKEGHASAQADKSFCIGCDKPMPDLSIEVIFTSGSLQKLSRYQVLGVPEVWFWEDGLLHLYALRSTGYEPIHQSELEGLRDLDLPLLQRCILMGETDPGQAMRTFWAEIQA
jgi:Uma2 family endonuclease